MNSKGASTVLALTLILLAIGTDDANSDFLKRLASRFDLGIKINRSQLASAIVDSSRMLPPPQNKVTRIR